MHDLGKVATTVAKEWLARTDQTDGHLAADILARAIIELKLDPESRPRVDWEIDQYDHEYGSTFVRRLRVPGGWLYQARERSHTDWPHAPVFVPAQTTVSRGSIDHGAIDLPKVEVFAPGARSMVMFATLVDHPQNRNGNARWTDGTDGLVAGYILAVGDLVAVEVPPNCSVHSADAAGLARVLDCARRVGEHWRSQDGINARYLDELAEATGEYWKDGEPCETPCGDPACGPAGGECRKGRAR